ncbi:MAG: hypothetical protein BroJett039_00050 [Chloroflexota bacterium]|nr:MAG: hypothetical protein BroJett039_00050 [Chloroflexota bacterium]
MSTVLEKVKRLEQYVATDENAIDQVVEQTLDKLFERETSRLESVKARLETQIVAFEQTYKMPTREFYIRFEQGELGDGMDFFEWSATYEMLKNLEKRMTLLASGHQK